MVVDGRYREMKAKLTDPVSEEALDIRTDLRSLVIESDPPTPYQVDGDHLGASKRLRFAWTPAHLSLLVPLTAGRLLVAKEKDPAALLLFGPADASSELLGDDLLRPGEVWDPPAGDVEFEAIAAWSLGDEVADHLEDLSGLAVGADRSLWLLSDQSQRVGRLLLDDGLGSGPGRVRGR